MFSYIVEYKSLRDGSIHQTSLRAKDKNEAIDMVSSWGRGINILSLTLDPKDEL